MPIVVVETVGGVVLAAVTVYFILLKSLPLGADVIVKLP